MNQDLSTFHPFDSQTAAEELPKQFTFPFRYEPHPLAVKAAEEVQRYLESRNEWKEEIDRGKMFGVLIVRQSERIGFLAAYSGILDGRNDHEYFVPPVYNLLQPDGFFKTGEKRISDINRQIELLENGTERATRLDRVARIETEGQQRLAAFKERMKADKQRRDMLRSTTDDPALMAELTRESQHQKAEYKRMERQWKEQLAEARSCIENIDNKILTLKEERKVSSNLLQQEIFSRFIVRNAWGETQDLYTLFQNHRRSLPPAGAGECAAPKLLQHAYRMKWQPLAMAEFWWGRSPKTELRRHGHFYPSCISKCEPILSFMLQGLDVMPNPMTEKARRTDNPEIVYEDEWMVAVNKPEGMYSVPGKDDVKSVYSWAKEHFPDADGPLAVHRLDMDTSGLLLLAKTKETHCRLQKMFETRMVRKKYVAVLDGIVEPDSGFVRLPLRPDPDDRPRQVVDTEWGKPAVTRFQVLSRSDRQTRVALFPETGRTHQLRVHCAHHDGLNAPIAGDALYGRTSHRLYLHAEKLEFKHFVTGKLLRLKCSTPF